MQVTLQPDTIEKKTLKPRAKAKKETKNQKAQQHEKRLIWQSRDFHNAFLNQKSLRMESVKACNSHRISPSILRYDMGVFTPHPRSYQAQITTKYIKFKYSITYSVCRMDYHSKGFELHCLRWCSWCLVRLGRTRGLSDLMFYQSYTELDASINAISFREFLSNEAHQTYCCLYLGKMGFLLARLTCCLQLPHLKPHTGTSKDILVIWLVSTYPRAPAATDAVQPFTKNSFVVFHVMVYLCSTIQRPPPPTTYRTGSAFCFCGSNISTRGKIQKA